jgi:hypothetical protein
VHRVHRRRPEAVPVMRPLASRNVVVPFESVVAVPVVRPDPSRNVRVPGASRVAVPVIRPLPSRYVTVPLASRLAVPVMRPILSLNVSVCAPAGGGSNSATSRARRTMPQMAATFRKGLGDLLIVVLALVKPLSPPNDLSGQLICGPIEA